MGSRSGLSCEIRLNSHLPEAYRSVFQDPGTITRILEEADVVMDKCMKMEHGRYSGGLHSMGMNTELITSRRGMRMLERE